MSDRVTDQIGSLIRRLSQTLNRKVSEIVLLFSHKHAPAFGALAGFAIAVIFTWKFLRPVPGRQRRNRPKRRAPQSAAGGGEGSGVGSSSQDRSLETSSKDLDEVELPVELNLVQIVRRKLNGAGKMTCQLLGVILEERNPEELQKQATVRPSVLEALLEISKTCDVYFTETVLDDESEERVLSALEGAGLFLSGGLTKDKRGLRSSESEEKKNPTSDRSSSPGLASLSKAEKRNRRRLHLFPIQKKVLFCSTDMGRSSFVRQLEPDWHVDSKLEIVSQLARFIRNQLHISQLELGQIAPNVFTSESLEKYFACL